MLRIGLLVDNLTVPRWVADCVASVQHSAIARIAVVALPASTPHRSKYDPGRRIWNPFRTDQLYLKLESLVNREARDPLAPLSLESIVGAADCLRISPIRAGHGSLFDIDDDGRRAIGNSALDVILLFGFGLPATNLLPLARHGFWWYEEIARALVGATPIGLMESLQRRTSPPSRLLGQVDGMNGTIVLYESLGPTHYRFAGMTRRSMLLKSSQYVVRALHDLNRRISAPSPPAPPALDPVPYVGNGKRVSNTKVAWWAGRAAGRFLGERVRNLFTEGQWTIAFRLGSAGDPFPGCLNEYTVLDVPREWFWADPFPWTHQGRHWVFIEQCTMPEGKGFISALEVGPEGILRQPEPVFECEGHTSFPFIFEHEDQIYMIPESAFAEQVRLYRCVDFPLRWEHECNLLENVNAVDTVLYKRGGTWWMFTGIAANGAWNVDELCVFHADSPRGPWHPHERNPVVSDARCGRMAGGLFERDGRLMRPGQDSSIHYGQRIRIMEVAELTETTYVEREVQCIEPDWALRGVRTHTINRHGGFFVADIHRRLRK